MGFSCNFSLKPIRWIISIFCAVYLHCSQFPVPWQVAGSLAGRPRAVARLLGPSRPKRHRGAVHQGPGASSVAADEVRLGRCRGVGVGVEMLLVVEACWYEPTTILMLALGILRSIRGWVATMFVKQWEFIQEKWSEMCILVWQEIAFTNKTLNH